MHNKHCEIDNSSFMLAYLSNSKPGFEGRSCDISQVSIISEILNGIRVIKMYAWERSFFALLTDARKEEMRMLRKKVLSQVGPCQSHGGIERDRFLRHRWWACRTRRTNW